MLTSSVQPIIEQVRAGDLDAFAEIVRTYQHEIMRIVAYAMRDRPTSEDLVQQTFVNAYMNLEKFEPDQDFGAWLRAIARSVVRNELRRGGREAKRLRRYQVWLEQRLGNNEQAERDEQRLASELEKCRERLSESAGKVLSMRYELAMGFEEMASALGRTVEATRQMLTRIRTSLRQCMEERRSQA